MLLPLGPFVDPPTKKCNLRVGQRRTLGRHLNALFTRRDSLQQFALRSVLGGDRVRSRFELRKRGLFAVESQAPFSLVRPVTGITPLGQDRLNLATKVDRLGQCLGSSEL